MNIEIPKGFRYGNYDEGHAFEENGKLIIKGNVSFEKMIYTLTYELKGDKVCYYCGEVLSSQSRTMDHLYPRSFGGITIPLNLEPCCNSCNEKKGNITENQFHELINLPEIIQKSALANMISENSRISENYGFLLPESWISTHKISKVILELSLDDSYYKGKKYKKIKRFYKKTHKLPRPIIISSNSFLLDGFLVLMFAKNAKISSIPAIILDNIIVK